MDNKPLSIPKAPKAPKDLPIGAKSISVKDVWWAKIKGELKTIIIAYISENVQVIGFTLEKPSIKNSWQPPINYVSKDEIVFGDLVSFDPLPGHPEALFYNLSMFK